MFSPLTKCIKIRAPFVPQIKIDEVYPEDTWHGCKLGCRSCQNEGSVSMWQDNVFG